MNKSPSRTWAGLPLVEHKPLIMGVLNLTPDSFSDGGAFLDPERACEQAESLLGAGADILDVGAESTRPGAHPVELEEEWGRLAPVLERLAKLSPIPTLSVDTTKPEIFRRAWQEGVRVFNDVSGFQSAAALGVAAETDAALVVMHMQGTPETMQDAPRYENLTQEIKEFFAARLTATATYGIEKGRIALDPGIGFGKTLAHNLEILQNLPDFLELGCPLLVGLSRKSWIAQIDSHEQAKSADQRLGGSLAGAIVAMQGGASILRVHDVRETIQALRITHALNSAQAV